jgi:hypothetical protein
MKRPAFIAVADAKGIKLQRAPKLYTTNGLVTPHSRGITSREQGEADMHRRDAIKRGGL